VELAAAATMVVDIPARTSIPVDRINPFTASTSALGDGYLSQILSVSCHMAAPTQRDTVADIQPQLGMPRVTLQMMCGQALLILAALTTAISTAVAVSLED
jgi:hypothetical protein